MNKSGLLLFCERAKRQGPHFLLGLSDFVSVSFSLPLSRAWRVGNHSGAPGGTAGFCFDLRSRCAFMVPPKINTTRFLAPPQKAALGLASRDPLAFGPPRESGAEKEKPK